MHGSKAASVEEALTHIRSGQTIMLSGFTNVGSPNKFIVKMAEAGITDIDLISNDAGNDHTDGIGTLICQHRVRRLTASHVGLNPKVAEQMNAGTLEVVLVPRERWLSGSAAAAPGWAACSPPRGSARWWPRASRSSKWTDATTCWRSPFTPRWPW